MRTLFTSIVSWSLILSMVSSPLMASAASRSVSLERQYQRLYGRKVKTKTGAFTVRQMVDSKGHPYKQIIVGPQFSEIQIDSNRDGRVDIWEIDSGKMTVTMTGPARGQFSRMQVVDRTNGRGTMTVSYLLSPDGKRYNHQKTVVRRAGVLEYTDTGKPTSGGGVQSETFEVDAIVTQRPPAKLQEEFEPIVPDAMMLYQMDRLEDENQCLNAANDPVASAQRGWWKFLQEQGAISRDELAAQLRDSFLFDANCRRPQYAKDYDDLSRGIADIMLTSSLGYGQPESNVRGQFLQCLENSNLALAAAKLEKKFLGSVAAQGSRPDYPPITCNWDPAGGRVKGSYLEKDRVTKVYMDQVDVRMCTRHAGIDKYPYGAPINYRNLLFHELLHSMSYVEEDIDKIVGCCGEPSDERDKACKDLDVWVGGNQRRNRLENRLGNNKAAVDQMIYKMEDLFNTKKSPEAARKIYDLYVEQLAAEVNLDACLGLKGIEQINCRSDQHDKISSATEKFFKRKCVDFVERISANKCLEFDSLYGNNLSRAVTESIFGSLNCGAKKAALPKSDFFAWLLIGAKAAASDCSDVTDAPGRDVETPGGAAEGSTPPASVDAPAPRTMVPSPSTGSETAAGPQAPGTQPAPIAVPDSRTASPLPITRIDKEPRPERYVEDRYRQATDFAGRATAGLSKLRQAILPEAEASERSRGSTEFVAFRPGKARGYNAAIESPFKNWRGLASVNSGAAAGSTVMANNTAVAVSSRGAVAGLEAPEANGSPRSMNKKPATVNIDGDGGRSSVGASVQVGGGSGSSAAAKSAANSGSSSKASRDVASTSALDGLFTKPYREIEHRLVRIEVIEQLMKQEIAIKDAKGRSLGSSRPTKKYQFVRQDRPLAEVP